MMELHLREAGFVKIDSNKEKSHSHNLSGVNINNLINVSNPISPRFDAAAF